MLRRPLSNPPDTVEYVSRQRLTFLGFQFEIGRSLAQTVRARSWLQRLVLLGQVPVPNISTMHRTSQIIASSWVHSSQQVSHRIR